MWGSRALALAALALALCCSVHAGPVNLTALITSPLKLPDTLLDPPSWQPITLANYATYLPGLKDWASVITACKAAGKKERRLYNFFIRMAFHDAMAVDLKACIEGDKANCHGADSSVLLSVEEMLRPENGHDGLSEKTAKAILHIASFYGVSVADALAVCSTVAVEELSRHRVKFFGGESGHEKTFRVGRLDWVPGESSQTPPDTLPAKDIANDDFDAFWKSHNLTLEEGIALMGSHAILELQGCRTGPKPDDFCDPRVKDDCKDLRMFKWDNHYYKDMCTPSVKITPGTEPPAEKDPKDMTDAEFEELQKTQICKWTSKEERILQLEELQEMREGTFQEDPDEPEEPEEKPYLVEWTNEGCEAAAEWGNDADYCPHTLVPSSEPWMYTVNDAHLAVACGSADASGVDLKIQEYMRKFALDQDEWDKIFKQAWLKVLTKYANWPLINDLTDKPTMISGKECKIYKLDKKCKEGGLLPGISLPIIDDIASCAGCGTLKVGSKCDDCCICNTAFSVDGIARSGKALLEDFVMPDLPELPKLPDVAGVTDIPDLPSLDTEYLRRRRR